MVTGISLLGRLGGKDLKRFASLPILFQWRWTPDEWVKLSGSYQSGLDWRGLVWRRVLGFAFGCAAAVMALRWLPYLNKESFSNAKTGEEFAIFLFIALLVATVAIAIQWLRHSDDLHPRAGDEPVCIVTAEAIKVGNQIFWFQSLRGPLVRVEAGSHEVWGQTLVLTRRYMVPPHGHIDIPVVVAVPKERAGSAVQISEMLATQIGAYSGAKGPGFAKARAFDVPASASSLKIAAILMLAGCAYLGQLIWNDYKISRSGIITQAQLVRKDTWTQNHVQTYILEYVFKTRAGKKISGEGYADEKHYTTLQPGDSFPVRYVETNPNLSEPWRGENRWAFWGKILLLLVGLGVAIKTTRDAAWAGR